VLQMDTEPLAPVAAKNLCKTVQYRHRARATGHRIAEYVLHELVILQTVSPTRSGAYHRCNVIQYDFLLGTPGTPTEKVRRGWVNGRQWPIGDTAMQVTRREMSQLRQR